jgi:hypothetical protein
MMGLFLNWPKDIFMSQQEKNQPSEITLAVLLHFKKC